MKTLKDFELDLNLSEEQMDYLLSRTHHEYPKLILANEIRQSAISDIKKLKEEILDIEHNEYLLNHGKISILPENPALKVQKNNAKIEFIKKKFNITKEDLR